MSDIIFSCPKCGGHLAVDSRGAGTTVSCPLCNHTIIIPARAAARKIVESNIVMPINQVGGSRLSRTTKPPPLPSSGQSALGRWIKQDYAKVVVAISLIIGVAIIYNVYQSCIAWNKKRNDEIKKDLQTQEEKSWTTLIGYGDDPILGESPPTWVHLSYSINGKKIEKYNFGKIAYRGSTIRFWLDSMRSKGDPDMIVEGATEIQVFKGLHVNENPPIEKPASLEPPKNTDDENNPSMIVYKDRSSAAKQCVTTLAATRKAAEQGDMAAQFRLGAYYGDFYVAGRDRQDVVEAMKWYRKSAEQGLPIAQFFLAYCYHGETGVKRDIQEVIKWYRRAAEQGFIAAQLALASMYGSGFDVPKNDAESLKWWRLAAEQGDALAQEQLGRQYLIAGLNKLTSNRGNNREEMIEAYKWFSIAAANPIRRAPDGGPGPGSARDDMLKYLSPEDVAEAQRRAAEFVDTKKSVTPPKY